jgi:membrane protein DedA with SNARE-associated domain/rhodanese-related sulfurtransferase
MQKLMLLQQQYGLAILFGNVLLEQLGLPIPAVPALVVAGALAANGQLVWFECLAIALLACMLSDFLWFSAGRHYGKKTLKLLCRISISPDYCVSQTEDAFNHWGPKSLLVSKFIPGFSVVAPPLAGAMGTRLPTFLSLSFSGGLIWTCSFLTLGAAFHNSIDNILAILGAMGFTALLLIGALLALVIGVKFYERRRFYKSLRMARITVAELKEMMEDGHKPLIVDARGRTAQQTEAPIPGALMYDRDAPPERAGDIFLDVSRDRPIIVYCSCPNEASAAIVAKLLIAHGFRHVRPLIGGLDAWNAMQQDSVTHNPQIAAQTG